MTMPGVRSRCRGARRPALDREEDARALDGRTAHQSHAHTAPRAFTLACRGHRVHVETITVHAPQPPSPQPSLVPGSATAGERRYSSSVMSGSASATSWRAPFT